MNTDPFDPRADALASYLHAVDRARAGAISVQRHFAGTGPCLCRCVEADCERSMISCDHSRGYDVAPSIDPVQQPIWRRLWKWLIGSRHSFVGQRQRDWEC